MPKGNWYGEKVGNWLFMIVRLHAMMRSNEGSDFKEERILLMIKGTL